MIFISSIIDKNIGFGINIGGFNLFSEWYWKVIFGALLLVIALIVWFLLFLLIRRISRNSLVFSNNVRVLLSLMITLLGLDSLFAGMGFIDQMISYSRTGIWRMEYLWNTIPFAVLSLLFILSFILFIVLLEKNVRTKRIEKEVETEEAPDPAIDALQEVVEEAIDG